MFSPQRIIRITMVVLAAGAIAAPVASARPARFAGQPVAASSSSVAQAPQPSAAAYTRQDKQLVPSSSSQTPVNPAPRSAQTATASDGFDWGDAGIGAAGGLAISIVGIGGALVLSQRRTRRTRPTAIAAS